ncbi:hypothetical protein J3E68DRAFT_388239 [Trichoderma sp. SZMC 28012]
MSQIQQLCWFAVACSTTFMVGVTVEKAKFDLSSYQIQSYHIISHSMVPYLQSDSYNIQGISPHNTSKRITIPRLHNK